MATISLNDDGKAVGEAVHVTLSSADFELADGSATYETDDPALIREAKAHPWLTVEVPVDDTAERQAERRREEAEASDDPFLNPSKDHLSAVASPEAVEAAAAESQRIREATAVDQPESVVPDTPETPVTKRETVAQNPDVTAAESDIDSDYRSSN